MLNEPCSSIASGRESSESSSVGYRKVLRSFAEVCSILAELLLFPSDEACDRMNALNIQTVQPCICQDRLFSEFHFEPALCCQATTDDKGQVYLLPNLEDNDSIVRQNAAPFT